MEYPIVFRFRSPESSSGFLLWKVTQKWQSGLQKLLLRHNLTHPQFVVLAVTAWHLQIDDTVPTQKHISLRAEMDPMTVSAVVRLLVKKGFVERTANPSDSRAYSIRLTKAGSETLQKAMQAVDDYDENFFLPLAEEKENRNDCMLQILK